MRIPVDADPHRRSLDVSAGGSEPGLRAKHFHRDALRSGAVHYKLGQWPNQTIFLTHADVPLDNNRCEYAVRPFVIGR